MKKLLVLFTALIIVILSSLIIFKNRAITKTPREFNFNIKDRYKVEKVILESEPSEILKTAKQLKVKYERYKEEEIVELFGAKGFKYPDWWLEERKPEKVKEHIEWMKKELGERIDKNYDENYKKYLADNKNLWLEEGNVDGAFSLSQKGRYLTYLAPDQYINGYPPTNITFTEEEADIRARKWIEEHGGFPEDARLIRTRNRVDVPLSFEGSDDELRKKEKPEIVAYYLHYRHEFNGIPIFGDEIKVKIENPTKITNNTGIWSYYRRWSNPIDYIGEEKEIILPEKAVESVARLLAKDSGVKSDTPPVIKVKSVNLAYYDPEFGKGEIKEFNIFRPAWRFKFDEGRPDVIVDAHTGTAYFEHEQYF